jgi:hypothetical protein
VGLEETDLPVPVLAGWKGERGPQHGVDLPGARRATPAEQLEERAEVEGADARPLQLEEVVLPGVDVDRDDPGPRERVVEGVAARARDHEHAVLRPKRQGLVVDGRVLPALVVDEVLAVNRVEQQAGQASGGGERRGEHGVRVRDGVR